MLVNVATHELEKLLRNIDQVRTPLTEASLCRLGLMGLAKHREALTPLGAAGLKVLLSAIVAERAAQPPIPELVWTGPQGLTASARSTEVVFRDLLANAERDAWMAGYSITHGEKLFAPLHQAMVERGVTVRFILHLQYLTGEKRAKTVEEGAGRLIRRFFDKQWPFEGPKPKIYYDPRPLEQKPRANMHAKAVVVDERRVLIGSANFTQQGIERSIEAGALIDSDHFAKRLVTQFQSLISAGRLLPYEASP